jgi:predicted  nucleic acid-binding Zn-ribbon protein
VIHFYCDATVLADIEAARDRSLRELDIRISILNSQRATLADQLGRHEAKLASSAATGDSASQHEHEQETVAALQAEIASLDEAMAGRKQQSAALADAFASDMARFAELEDIVALRRQLSSPDSGRID